MTPEVERFLDLSTRPLEGSPGLRDEAKAELMARVSQGGVPLEMLDLSAPVERLAAAKPGNPWPRRTALLVAAISLIATVSAIITGQALEGYRAARASTASMMIRYGGFPGYPNPIDPILSNHLDKIAPDLPLGLNGDKETAEWLEKYPDDLPMLQQHAARALAKESTLTTSGTSLSDLHPDTLASIERLDPDNAVWPLMRMIPHLAKSTGSGRSYGYGAHIGSSVTDEPEFQQALRLFSEAAGKQTYRDHSLVLQRRQIDAFPRSRSIADDLVVTGIAQLVAPVFSDYSNELEALISIQVERLKKAGDQAGLIQLGNEWQQLATTLRGEVDFQSFNAQFQAIARKLDGAFGDLGMEAEKVQLTEWLKESDAGATPPLPGVAPEIEAAAGARLRGSLDKLADVTLAEVEPSRRTEHAYFDRGVASFLMVLALLVAGLIALETCRRSAIVKGMARGLMPLFRPVDHLWIGVLGIALPWLWWWVVTRLTPLGLRDLDFNDEWTVIPMIIQPATAFIFGLAMLLQTARWRWSHRGGFIGLGAPLSWLGWLAAALAGLAIPAAGVLRYLDLNDNDSGYYLLGVGSMAGCSLLWLLWGVVMNLFTPRASALRPNLAMRAALPWALAGVVTLIASGMISSAMERYWFARDPLLPTWTSKTHLNALEERTAHPGHP